MIDPGVEGWKEVSLSTAGCDKKYLHVYQHELIDLGKGKRLS